MKKFLVGKNGLFEEVENDLFKGVLKVEGDPSGPEIKEDVSLKFPKIPIRLLNTALAFARWGKEERRSEVSLVLLRDSNGYRWECPRQWTSMAHVCAHPEKDPDLFFDWVGDWHAHPGEGPMASEHSGTDHKDEMKKGNGIFIVTSGVTILTSFPKIYGVFAGRKRFEINIKDVFDERYEISGYQFPEEWRDRVFDGPCPICRDRKPDVDFGIGYGVGFGSLVKLPEPRDVKPFDGSIESMGAEELSELAARIFAHSKFDAEGFMIEMFNHWKEGPDIPMISCFNRALSSNDVCQGASHVTCAECKEAISDHEVISSIADMVSHGAGVFLEGDTWDDKERLPDIVPLEDPVGECSEGCPLRDTPHQHYPSPSPVNDFL